MAVSTARNEVSAAAEQRLEARLHAEREKGGRALEEAVAEVSARACMCTRACAAVCRML